MPVCFVTQRVYCIKQTGLCQPVQFSCKQGFFLSLQSSYNWLFNLHCCVLPSPPSHAHKPSSKRDRNTSSEVQLHTAKISTRYYSDGGKHAPLQLKEHPQSCRTKENKIKSNEPRSAWGGKRRQPSRVRGPRAHVTAPHPGKARSPPKPSRRGGQGHGGCRSEGSRGRGRRAQPSPGSTHTSSHPPPDAKENLRLETQGSF